MPESAAYAVALLAAATFGTADFLGGLASRRAGVLVATVVGQAAGFAVLLPGVLLQQALPDHSSVAWGALAGLSGSLGLLVFFSALAGGSMSLAAPAAAVVTAVVPVLAGLALGNRPSSQAWLGVAGGLLAVAAISWSGRDGRVGVRVLLLAVGAGVAFGVFFVCLSRASQAAGLWPIVAARMSSLTVLSGAVVAGRAEWRAARGALRLAVVSAGVALPGGHRRAGGGRARGAAAGLAAGRHRARPPVGGPDRRVMT